MDLSGFRETISTRGKILPARSKMVGSVNGKSIIVPRIRLVGQRRSLAHPTINKINVMPPTVFAATSKAFNKLPAGTVDTLVKPENKEMLYRY